MNRLTTALFSLALLLLGVVPCIGEETKPGPDYEQLKAMEWIIGDWEADWVVPSGGAGAGRLPSRSKRPFDRIGFLDGEQEIHWYKFRDD